MRRRDMAEKSEQYLTFEKDWIEFFSQLKQAF